VEYRNSAAIERLLAEWTVTYGQSAAAQEPDVQPKPKSSWPDLRSSDEDWARPFLGPLSERRLPVTVPEPVHHDSGEPAGGKRSAPADGR
jgi:hypothetical protein